VFILAVASATKLSQLFRNNTARRLDNMTRAPVYFISHGGPPSMFDENGGPYQAWKRVGDMIRQDVDAGKIDREKGLVCVSAHWESTDLTGKTIERKLVLQNQLKSRL
jgi:aromatic ring-opening dioxygenase catalytic subunit (LigB family)